MIHCDLLQAASFGKHFLTDYRPDAFVDMCRMLRVLNSVRQFDIGIPLTYTQYPWHSWLYLLYLQCWSFSFLSILILYVFTCELCTQHIPLKHSCATPWSVLLSEIRIIILKVLKQIYSFLNRKNYLKNWIFFIIMLEQNFIHSSHTNTA